ncbi:MAG: hypothetical protein KAI55_02625, partial [Candidatus Aenigmarchaeota archaeon]|nr:hypothetical protein [Candidatus Aenigmarchaeota archaeon]
MGKAKEDNKKIDKLELNKILKKYGYNSEQIPNTVYKKNIVISKEFTQYKAEDEKEKKLNWYERSAKFAQKIFNLAPPKVGEQDDLKMAINFLNYKVTPQETFSLAYFAVLLSLPIAIIPFSLNMSGLPIPQIFIIIFFLLPVIVFFYFYTYLQRKANLLRMKVGGDLVMAILYLIIYMKTTPNFEGAIRFAAKN